MSLRVPPPARRRDDPFVVVDGVTHRYGARIALRDCSLSVSRGTVLALAGPNGAGKTTLARLLAGFLAPTAGAIVVGGMPPIDFRRTCGIGFLQEEGRTTGSFTVGDFLALGGGAQSHPPIDADPAGALGCDRLANRRAASLSKGQWRSVLIAYATVGAPGLIILDEPESGLDPHGIDRVHHVIAAAAAHGSTVVVLSHQMHEIEKVCDRMIFLQDGAVVGQADRADLSARGARSLYCDFVNGAG